VWVLLALALVGVTAVVGGGWWLIHSAGSDKRNANASSPEWATAQVQDISISVIAEGDLVAKNDVDIFNLIEHPDDERIRDIVEEGTWVNAGDKLYTLSSPGLLSDHEEWESRVREAQADLLEAQQNLAIEREVAASAEAKAQLDLDLARLAQQEWANGTDRQRQSDLNLALEKAQRELEIATREYGFSVELNEQDFISATELEQDYIRQIEARNALATAELDIEVYNNYERVMTERLMSSDISQAEDELRRTQNKNENKMELMTAQVESRANELAQRQTRFAELTQMVANLEGFAPQSGIVMYSSTIGNRRERWYTIRPGTEVRGGWRIMVISDTSQLVANLYVHESRINDIRRQQEVAISVNARPDEVFMGTITEKKNSAMQDGGNNPHLRQYQVLADMPPDLGNDIRPGMNCSAEIYIGQIPDALCVPIQAVHTEGNDHFVYVAAAQQGRVRRQNIEIGGASDTLVQIVSGIDVGTHVLLRNPSPGEVVGEDLPITPPVAEAGR